jgi:hypothetical protein
LAPHFGPVGLGRVGRLPKEQSRGPSDGARLQGEPIARAAVVPNGRSETVRKPYEGCLAFFVWLVLAGRLGEPGAD